jgi:hypothetical protein
VEDILKGKGYDIDRELLQKAIAKPHRTICSPVNLEEERRSAIRGGFIEMLRKEFFEQDIQEYEKNGASRKSKAVHCTGMFGSPEVTSSMFREYLPPFVYCIL